MPGACRLRLALGGNAAPTTYDLVAPRSFAATPKAAKWQLVVNEPTAVHALDTDRIWCARAPTRSPTTRARPGATGCRISCRCAPSRRLQNSGAVKAVTSSSDRVDGDYSLSMEIRSFQIDAASGRPAADIDIFAKLINNNSSKVVASKSFTTRVASASDTPAAGVAALNQALTEVLQDTSTWVSARH